MKLNRLISSTLSAMVAAALSFSAAAVTTVTVATPAHAASTADGQITRSEVLSRAQYWVDQGYTYLNSSDKTTWRTGPVGSEKYRRDCSGLVSMVWHLSEGYYDTSVFESWIGGRITRLDSFNDLKPGDAVLRVNFKGLSDHIEVFAGWKNNADHGAGAYFYSFNSTGETVRNPYKDSNFGNLGFRSLSAITSDFEHAIHYNGILDDPGATPPVDDATGNGGLRADFNGDGLGDVAAFYDYPGLRTVLFVWSGKTGGGFTGPVNAWDSGAGGWDQTRSKPVSGDFNGDGMTDVGVFYDYPGLRTVLFTWTAKTGGGFTGPVNAWDSGAGGWDQTRSKPVTGDFNGDGMTDVGVFYDYPGLRTVLFTWSAKTAGGFTGPVNAWDSGAGGWDQTRSKPVSGDFNGDGMTDVGVFYDYPGLRTVLFTWSAKTAGGFTGPVNAWDSGAGGWDQTRSKPVSGDYNGDGRGDVGILYDYPGLRTVLFTWTAKTAGGFTGPVNAWDSGAGGWDQSRTKPL
ncbi:hypothetical protein [Sphaerisporangium album]|uniref:hypothetical protein n=1 Tax=Sphaerisporangium album TaxID=509200 RepID=UPI0015F0C401|nr:hypothetical protein [Sphaerisporangium album]